MKQVAAGETVDRGKRGNGSISEEMRSDLSLGHLKPHNTMSCRTVARTAAKRVPWTTFNAGTATVARLRSPYSTSSSPEAEKQAIAAQRPTPTPTPTNLPGSNLPGASKHSPATVSIVTRLAKLFGYNSQTSTAIRTASDYYDRCAERAEIQAPFFYEGPWKVSSLVS